MINPTFASHREISAVQAVERVYFSFWTHVPDHLLDRAIYIFRSHLDYHARPDGDVIHSFSTIRAHIFPLHLSSGALVTYIGPICITHATKMRFFAPILSHIFFTRIIYFIYLSLHM